MQGKTSHWFIRIAFLSFSVALGTGASLTATETHPPGDADRAEIQPGPPSAVEEQKPQPPASTQPLPPSGDEQPWQTSWEAFCGEWERLYKRGATKEEMDALYIGKLVAWEGITHSVSRETNHIVVEQQCSMRTADDRLVSLWAWITLHLSSAAEIPSDLNTLAKVRFSMTINEPNTFYDTVIRGEGETQLDVIFVSIRGEAKLLGYDNTVPDYKFLPD